MKCTVEVECERGRSWDDDEYAVFMVTSEPIPEELCGPAFDAAREWVATECRIGHGLDHETSYALRMELRQCDDGSGAHLDYYFHVTSFSANPWPATVLL